MCSKKRTQILELAATDCAQGELIEIGSQISMRVTNFGLLHKWTAKKSAHEKDHNC